MNMKVTEIRSERVGVIIFTKTMKVTRLVTERVYYVFLSSDAFESCLNVLPSHDKMTRTP